MTIPQIPDFFYCDINDIEIGVFAEISTVSATTSKVEIEIVKAVAVSQGYDVTKFWREYVDIYPLIEHHTSALEEQIKQQIAEAKIAAWEAEYTDPYDNFDDNTEET